MATRKLPTIMPTKMPKGVAVGSAKRMGQAALTQPGGKASIAKKGMPQKAGKPVCK